ncbi:MAG: FAD-binding oxidoreductase [Bdellovibrionales bacterium]|nr:FAD-binding oxidoreductase [Bdellovibrionales bacterium]
MAEILDIFSDLLPQDAVLKDATELESYGRDTSKNFVGTARVVLLPRTTSEVQKIVQRCIAERIALIPSGGRTGLCGAATATNNEVVLSLQRMNKVLEINPDDRMATTQAGVTTMQLKEKAAEVGLDFPLSLASWGTSQIGGNIATNAGGIHVIRYGHTRNMVLGLTVVTGSGTILNTGKALYKDNTGYDLKSLFVGSEGTLGIITEAILTLTPKPKSLTRILCALDSIADTIPLLSEVHKECRDLSAFEFFSDRALTHVTSHRKLKNPFADIYPCYVVVELEADPEAVEETLAPFFMSLVERELIQDIIIAQNSKQSEEIMNLREWISETLSSEFTPHKNDISVSVSKIPAFVVELQELMQREAPRYDLVLFGHVGDGNIHLNWLKPEEEAREQFFKESKRIDRLVLELVTSYGGSISAEHGIGLLKKDVLHLSRSKEEIALMRSIKSVFDPHGILNPGKIFDL